MDWLIALFSKRENVYSVTIRIKPGRFLHAITLNSRSSPGAISMTTGPDWGAYHSFWFRSGIHRIQRKSRCLFLPLHGPLLELETPYVSSFVGKISPAADRKTKDPLRFLTARRFAKLAPRLSTRNLYDPALYERFTKPWLEKTGADPEVFAALAQDFSGNATQLVEAAQLLALPPSFVRGYATQYAV